jgi:hypothetical protein
MSSQIAWFITIPDDNKAVETIELGCGIGCKPEGINLEEHLHGK